MNMQRITQISAFIAFSLVSSITTAQNIEPLLPPIPHSTAQNDIALPDVERYIAATHDILSHHQVIFMRAENAVSSFSGNTLSDLYLDTEYLQNQLGVTSISSFEELRDLEPMEMPDAVVFMSDVLADIKVEDEIWLHDAYWNGMVIGFINVPLQTQWQILGIECIGEGYYEDYRVDSYYVYAFRVFTEKPEDAARIIAAKQNCVQRIEDIELTGGYNFTARIATDMLTQPFGVHQMFYAMGLSLEDNRGIADAIEAINSNQGE